MSASRVAVLVGLIVLCFALYSNPQQVQTGTATAGTFQLVPAEYTITYKGSSWKQHNVFLVDSKGGGVWEYLPAGTDSAGKLRDAVLLPVVRGLQP